MKIVQRFLICFLSSGFLILSCTQVDLYEKNATIPQFKWKSNYKPEFTFTIKDTMAQYELFLVLRHNEKYNFNNIWLNIYLQSPGDSVRKISVEKRLASNEQGWFATAMDDIYEHRISLNQDLVGNNFSFRKAGDYHFMIEQIMREDPLLNVMNVGLRIEKKQP
jgi:gliding motility-associated lipoprotein GldH